MKRTFACLLLAASLGFGCHLALGIEEATLGGGGHGGAGAGGAPTGPATTSGAITTGGPAATTSQSTAQTAVSTGQTTVATTSGGCEPAACAATDLDPSDCVVKVCMGVQCLDATSNPLCETDDNGPVCLNDGKCGCTESSQCLNGFANGQGPTDGTACIMQECGCEDSADCGGSRPVCDTFQAECVPPLPG